MKLLVINGSPRKNGNTAKALAIFSQGFAAAMAGFDASAKVEVETIALAGADIRHCLGCRACFDRGEGACPLKDDVASIQARLAAADALVVATPVYMENVSGLLKDWIDRCAWQAHRPGLGGKPAFVLATTGTTPSRHAVASIKAGLRAWGAALCGSLGLVAGAGLDTGEAEARLGPAMRKAARGFAKTVAGGRATKPGFIELVYFGVQRRYWLRHADTSFDALWWRDRGFLEKGRRYSAPCESPRAELAAAAVVSRIVAALVLR
jgi:multimeric flavodoxin WrbA